MRTPKTIIDLAAKEFVGHGYVVQNIDRSFPNATDKEKKRIKRKFYRHFTDLLAESVKGLSISESELRRRISVKNPELMDDLFKSNKNVLLVSGHYNNWEWVILYSKIGILVNNNKTVF